jgi:hypothetical protein
MGLFADDLIRGIVHTVRRERRLNRIRKWKTAHAFVQRFRTIEGEIHGLRPVIDYIYAIDGKEYSGSATGCSLRSGINELGDTIDAMIEAKTPVVIRYNPEHFGESAVRNGDNGGWFAFDVDDDLF